MSAKEIVLHLSSLYPLQAEIAGHPARFKVLVIGRRGGKTLLAQDVLGNAALDGKRAAYFAPTFPMQLDVFQQFNTTFNSVISKRSIQEKRYEFLTGGSVDFWSAASPDSVRGQSYDLVIIDEAAMTPNLEYIWSYVVRPTLVDRAGAAYFLSTPRGKNFFYTLSQRGNDPAWPDWETWHAPTSANPHIDAIELDDAKRELPSAVYRQEIEAQFTDDGGQVFRNLDACLVGNPATAPNPTHKYYFGVDWGKANDFTVVAIFDKTDNRMVAMDRFNQIGWSLQRERLIKLAHQFRPRMILAESNSIGEPNIEALQAVGLDVQSFMTTQGSKAMIIEKLALELERGGITLIDDPVLRGELEAFGMNRTPSGSWQYGAPSGFHDDTVIAVALALHASGKQMPSLQALSLRYA